MGRHENTDNPQQQPDKDQGGTKPSKEPWKDWGHDEEVKGGRHPGEERRGR